MSHDLVFEVSTPGRPVVTGRSVIGPRQLWFAGSVVLALVIIGLVDPERNDEHASGTNVSADVFGFHGHHQLHAALLIIKGTIGEDGDSIRLAAYLYVAASSCRRTRASRRRHADSFDRRGGKPGLDLVLLARGIRDRDHL